MTTRINITIPKEIHTAARVYGVENGKTMAEMVAEALQLLLDKKKPGKVVLRPDGEARREVPLEEIEIPDLWHIAMLFNEGKAARVASIFEEQEMVDRIREEILETWHLAHDLKRNLAGDI